MLHEASNLILSLSHIIPQSRIKRNESFQLWKQFSIGFCQQVITYHSDGESIKTWQEQIPA